MGLHIVTSGAPLTHFNDGGGGGLSNFLGLKFWPKVIFVWVYETDAGIFLDHKKKKKKKKQGFFGAGKIFWVC